MLQVDFANKFIGGGVLGHGCVQEEIRFVINPELLVSKLFTECLKPQEALIMVGAEQFNLSAGYASSFEWTGSFEDSTPLDESRRRKCSIVGIDALQFNNLVIISNEEKLKDIINIHFSTINTRKSSFYENLIKLT